MRRRIFIFQLLITFVVGLAISIIFALADGGLRYYEPKRPSIIILLTMAVCLLTGLPLRMNTKINNWWTHHQLIPLAGIVTGCLLMFLSFLPYFRLVRRIAPDVGINTYDPSLSFTGWVLTVFCLLHLYPIPLRRTLWARPEVYSLS